MAKLFNQHTNRQGLFVYGGESSADYGMVIGEAPTFEQPNRKQTVFNVPGRNGAILLQQDAWDDVTRTYKVWVAKNNREDLDDIVRAFTSWLNSQNGYVRLEDSFEPDVYRKAYYSGGNDVSNELTQYGESKITFTCRPERFLKEFEEYRPFNYGRELLFNPTRFTAKPIIRLEGNGTIVVGISGTGSFMTVNLGDSPTHIILDSEKMDAFSDTGVNMNDKISGTFQTIASGKREIAAVPTSAGAAVTKSEIILNYYTI